MRLCENLCGTKESRGPIRDGLSRLAAFTPARRKAVLSQRHQGTYICKLESSAENLGRLLARRSFGGKAAWSSALGSSEARRLKPVVGLHRLINNASIAQVQHRRAHRFRDSGVARSQLLLTASNLRAHFKAQPGDAAHGMHATFPFPCSSCRHGDFKSDQTSTGYSCSMNAQYLYSVHGTPTYCKTILPDLTRHGNKGERKRRKNGALLALKIWAAGYEKSILL